MSYKLGSFNICNFNDPQKSSRQFKTDIDLIAKIIKNERFDILALQEVLAEEVLRDYLIPALNKRGGKWDYRWAKPQKSDSYEAEGYAFIWNTKTMELSYSNKLEKVNGYSSKVKRTVEPHIYNQYRIDRTRGEFQLSRNPYYGRFKPIHGFCEFRLINTHIRSGKDSKDHYWGLTKLNDVGQRRNEAYILNRVIYHNISKKVYGNNMPAYTFLLGDYNLNMESSGCGSPYYPDYMGIIKVNDNGTEQRIRVVQEEATSLKKPQQNERDNPNAYGFANNFDHFSYDDDRFKGVRLSDRRVNTVSKYCSNDFRKHLDIVSDHVPIAMMINLRNENILWEED